MALYDRTEALRLVDEWIAEHGDAIAAAGGELPPELAQLLEDAEGEFDAKVERVALYIRELEATAATIKAESARLAARQKARENAVKGLKEYLRRNLEAAGRPSVKGDLVTVRVQANPMSVRPADGFDAELAYKDPAHPLHSCVSSSVAYSLDLAPVVARIKASTAALEAVHKRKDATQEEIAAAEIEFAKATAGVVITRGSHVRLA